MSLPPTYIDEIKRIIASISVNLPGYRTRDSQKRMIAAIAEVLSRAPAVPVKVEGEETPPLPENTGKSILCVQGPTGVGKSLGYLIGATVAARAQGRKLVVSSATVALQEQLVSRDVPFFVKNSGLNITCTIAKGRGRYVCHAKLLRAAGMGSQDEMFENDDPAAKLSATEAKRFTTLAVDYAEKKWSGDRDELPTYMADALWSQITTDRHGCLNSKCPNFKTCAQMAARDRIKTADIVVCNHDLLLADMNLGGGVILPAPAETFYVLDEGHHIAQKAVETFASQHHVDAGRMMMEKLAVSANKMGQSFHQLSPLALQLGNNAEYMSDALNDAYMMFDNIGEKLFNGGMWRFPNNQLPEAASTLASNIIKTSASLLDDLAKAQEALRDQDSVLGQKLLVDTGFFRGKVEGIHDTWKMLATECGENDVPVAKWVTMDRKQNGKVDYIVNASPVVAAKMLANMFFKRAPGVILTSATLMTLGNFDQLLRETGLEMLPDTALLSLPSPFDHSKQGVLRIPNINASAKQQDAHTAAIAANLPALIKETGNRGTLVLFASRKQLNDVLQALPPDVRNIVQVQGERSKDAILSEHNLRITSGKPSALFGLQSFAEGLDLPGDACSHVVIAKIPFSVPSDPVQETLSKWLESQNKSYFNEIALPQACLRLIQAAGRLIRTETDEGLLTILDDRLVNTRYGRQIRDSLPPFRLQA